MDTTMTVIRPDAEPETTTVTLSDHEPDWGQVRPLIASVIDGHIERVRVWVDGRYTDMFVAEDGHSKGLPHNALATQIYRANVLEHVPGTDPENLPTVVGVAVLFSRRVYF